MIIRAVLDTNVLVDALLDTGQDLETKACRRIGEAIKNGQVCMVMNRDTLREYLYVMAGRAYDVSNRNKPVFLKFLQMSLAMIHQVEYTNNADTKWPPEWIMDNQDAMFIECAIDSSVAFVVSSDRALKHLFFYNREQPDALRELHHHNLITLTPSQFVQTVLKPQQETS